MKRIKVGLIGCGTIGTAIALACEKDKKLNARLDIFAICDIDAKKAAVLKGRLKKKVNILKLDEIIDRADFIVEAASSRLSGAVVEKCIRKKKGCLVMSVGGLLGKEGLLKTARERGVRLCIPSGAICGIDALKAASVGKIDSVTLTTRKPPKALEGAPYLKKKGMDISSLTEDEVIFEGNASDAVGAFPQNINVAAVLSLAGVGAEYTRVRIIATPRIARNVHEVEIRGDSGTIFTRVENVPSIINPKTSQLAVYSAIAVLAGIADSVRIGT